MIQSILLLIFCNTFDWDGRQMKYRFESYFSRGSISHNGLKTNFRVKEGWGTIPIPVGKGGGLGFEIHRFLIKSMSVALWVLFAAIIFFVYV